MRVLSGLVRVPRRGKCFARNIGLDSNTSLRVNQPRREGDASSLRNDFKNCALGLLSTSLTSWAHVFGSPLVVAGSDIVSIYQYVGRAREIG